MRKQTLLLLTGSCMAALLCGCSDELGSNGDQTTALNITYGIDSSARSYVGAKVCIDCHTGFSWSANLVDDYLAGVHVIHSDHIAASNEDEGCLTCHDPIGDGQSIEPLISEEDVPQGGLAAVTCEACHGAGGDHYGVGPLPEPQPDYMACGQCHNADFFHNQYHPEADNILEDYLAGGHFLEEVDHNSNICAKCHVDEGARLYKNVSSAASLEATVFAVDNPSVIQCRTCHNAHDPSKLLKEASYNGSGDLTASAEYNTCTNCHQAHDAQVARAITQLAGSSSSDGYSGDLIYHAGRWTRVISSTHYDDPATGYESSQLDPADPDYAPNIVEGYVLDPANERVCRDCHNVHAADVTINIQWAMSGHGGGIIEAKEAAADTEADRSIEQVMAVRAAGADEDAVFAHYDWDAANRQSCQMCHTATGLKNFLNDPENYDPVNNDFSHLDGWVADDPATAEIDESVSSGQNELLYCWGCHLNNSGELRDPGAVSLGYTYNNAEVTIPDIGNSNVCVNCHGGRGNYDSIVDDSTSSRFEGHHAPTAGTLFSALTHIAYEFTGLDYTDKSYFAHNQIGTTDSAGNEVKAGTGSSGPCVSCHMASSSHTFEVVTKNASGVITAINNQALCNVCHLEHPMTPAVLEEEKEGFGNAGQLLADYLTNVIPNTYNSDITDTANLLNYETITIEGYGAYQNYRYLSLGEDPGAFAHNRYYAKRIIFDTIDFMDNGTLNGTINIDLTTYPKAGAWLGADETTGVATRP